MGRLQQTETTRERHRGGRGSRRRNCDQGMGCYGALDLGTNNCRLLIARPTGGGFRVVASYSKIVRLGEGLAESGRLSEDAIQRTIDALKICAEKLAALKVRRHRNVSTEACRRAENCREFFDRIHQETGLSFEAISVDEEARLALAGCQTLLDHEAAHALVFDIGGGSTEIVWAERGATRQFQIIDVLSLPIGVVNLAEKFGTRTVTLDTYRAMTADVAQHLPEFCARNGIGDRVGEGKVQMLGTSGTVTTLGAVHLELPRYSRSAIDGLELGFDALKNATDMLVGMSYRDRVGVPCIGEDRADLVIPGCAILEALCQSWPVGQLRVADRGLREGMLLELMADDGIKMTGNSAATDRHPENVEPENP